MYSGDVSKPVLIEGHVKGFLNETLRKCHRFKQEYYNTLFNIFLFVVVCGSISLILYIKYKGKPTPEELEQKEYAKHQYILSKIKNFQDARLMAQEKLITGLPIWQNEIDILY
jgi:hypothetical protein